MPAGSFAFHAGRGSIFLYMYTQRLTVGTRGSALALKQADITAQALTRAQPGLKIELKIIETTGDANQNPIPLDTVGKGWFTKEIEQALIQKDIDIAVHSLKDMAEDMPPGLAVGAYLEREDARDALITKHGEALEALKPGAIVGTDSARRSVQIRALRPDVQVTSLRGNVPTRLEKLQSGPYDAVILAVAGLKRLGLEECITRVFEPNQMTPAPGQGVLALQMREGDDALRALLERVNVKDVAHTAHIERAFSKALGGGCKSPTGAYAYKEGDECVLLGMREGSGGQVLRSEMRAPWAHSSYLGDALARELLSHI